MFEWANRPRAKNEKKTEKFRRSATHVKVIRLICIFVLFYFFLVFFFFGLLVGGGSIFHIILHRRRQFVHVSLKWAHECAMKKKIKYNHLAVDHWSACAVATEKLFTLLIFFLVLSKHRVGQPPSSWLSSTKWLNLQCCANELACID